MSSIKSKARLLVFAASMTAIVATGAALVGIPGFMDPEPAHADTAKYYLDCPTTEVGEGQSVDVYLVRVTSHTHTLNFGASWHTDAGTAGTEDYVHQNTGIIWSTAAERSANRVTRTSNTREDSLHEDDETFTIRFSPTEHVVDADDPDRDEKCDITTTDDNDYGYWVTITHTASGSGYTGQDSIKILVQQ